MIPIKRKVIPEAMQKKIEVAFAKSNTNEANAEDIMTALVELADMIATQDDALVEIAGLMAEGE